MQQEIEIASKMYRARDSMKRMLKDSYPGKVGIWMTIVRGVSEGKDLTLIEAAMVLLEDANKRPQEESALLSIWILAATVELIEPSF